MKYLLMNLFGFAISFFIFIICIVCGYILITGVTYKDLPAPNFSNSISFNDKLEFLQNKKADIIAIGSSMTLNNLHSGTIVEKFNSHSYLNLASWGICMKDIYLLFKASTRIHKPTICIISSNLIDFEKKDININYDDIYHFLSAESTENYKFHLKNFNASYYANNSTKMKEYKRDKEIYEYLGYDKYGAVLLKQNNFKINKGRWMRSEFSEPQEEQYKYLDSLSLFCKLKNIQLYFFESPFREGIYTSNQLDRNAINKHMKKVSEILGARNQYVVNANNRIWKDDLFLDAIHFHELGSRLYTEYCFKQIKSIYD